MRYALGFLIGACLASPALAADWVHFADCGVEGQSRHYSFDRSTVRGSGPERLVSITGDYSRAGGRAKSARIQWSIDCSGGTYRERSRIHYGANGKVLQSYRKPTGRMGIVAGSVADKLSQRVCAQAS
jgi:hypothetical protein